MKDPSIFTSLFSLLFHSPLFVKINRVNLNKKKCNNYTNTVPWLDPTFTEYIFIDDIKTTKDTFVKTDPCLLGKSGGDDNSAHAAHGQVEGAIMTHLILPTRNLVFHGHTST